MEDEVNEFVVVTPTKTLMSELRVMAVVASTVDAIMLFLIVCTARTPFFIGSCGEKIQK